MRYVMLFAVAAVAAAVPLVDPAGTAWERFRAGAAAASWAICHPGIEAEDEVEEVVSRAAERAAHKNGSLAASLAAATAAVRATLRRAVQVVRDPDVLVGTSKALGTNCGGLIIGSIEADFCN